MVAVFGAFVKWSFRAILHGNSVTDFLTAVNASAISFVTTPTESLHYKNASVRRISLSCSPGAILLSLIPDIIYQCKTRHFDCSNGNILLPNRVYYCLRALLLVLVSVNFILPRRYSHVYDQNEWRSFKRKNNVCSKLSFHVMVWLI